MGKINILEKHVAELIAAGEVVERPSSAVKELVENCIDAGASCITVEIRHGGITFIRVTDNGCGIAREDVPTAFIRNATSKIKSSTDLDRIGTLGFRGEALASICAVARVELITCEKGNDLGTRYEINGGEQQFFDDFGCPEGTTIIVRDLFYNVPARMKFLKKDVSEANAVAGVVDRIALSHPEVSFNFIRDGKKTLSTPGNGDLYACVYSVYGRDFAKTLVPIDYELNGIKVTGFVSKPLDARGSRSMQHFFLNGRYVKTRTAMAAMEEAFKNSIMVGKFPACVMFLETPLDAVDVNVHPAKIEVRFLDEKVIFNAVYYAVSAAISKNDKPRVVSFEKSKPSPKLDDKKNITEDKFTYVPQKKNDVIKNELTFLDIESQEYDKPLKIPEISKSDDDQPEVFIPRRLNLHANEKITEKLPEKKIEPEIKSAFDAIKIESQVQMPLPDNLNSFKKPENEKKFNVIGEAFKTYVIVEESDDQLLIIDKHAAHERLIFEKLKSQNRQIYSQTLISPCFITLSKEEYDVILDNVEILRDAGFAIEDFGSSMIKVSEVPSYISSDDFEPIILEVAGHLKQNKKDITTAKLDWLYHNIACRAAIKAGVPLKKEEMIALVNQLRENPEIKYCPHGRPVFIVMRKRDLEKQFGRINS